MTEEEAKGKWCPLARVAEWASTTITPASNDSIAATNRPIGVDSYCIGSACMAWRWKETYEEARNRYRIGMDPDIRKMREGYCGAFGME